MEEMVPSKFTLDGIGAVDQSLNMISRMYFPGRQEQLQSSEWNSLGAEQEPNHRRPKHHNGNGFVYY